MTEIFLASELGTNYTPSDQECFQIKQQIFQQTIDLNELKVRMDAAFTIYDNIRKQYDALLTTRREYEALLSPIRRIPVDVLRHIFFCCLPTDTNAVICPTEIPILLTRVCRGWRDIAFTTPVIWSRIHVAAPPAPPIHVADSWMHSIDTRCKLTLDCFAMSGACPLYISFYRPDYYSLSAYGYRLLVCVVNLTRRWKEVDLCFAQSDIARIFQMPSSAFPILKSLRICPVKDLRSHNHPYSGQNSGIFQAPNLTAISLRNIPEDFSKLPLNWERLTTLSLEGETCKSRQVSALLHILELCGQLLQLHVEIDPQKIFDYAPIEKTVTLRELRSLVLHDNGCGLLNCLQVPSLTHLQFFCCHPATKISLISLLRRIPGSLQTLITNCTMLSNDEFITCLHLCPNLSRLSCLPNPSGMIHHADFTNMAPQPACNFSDNLLDLLCTPDPAGRIFLPDLEVLECTKGADFSDQKLLEFVRFRRDGLHPEVRKLKAVAVRLLCEPGDPKVQSALNDLNGEDFNINIQYREPKVVPIISQDLYSNPRIGLPRRSFFQQFDY